MTFIILVIAALLILSFPTLRCAVSHPLKLVRYGVVDLYQYIKYQKWNECSTGELIAYVGLFGKGKPCQPSTRLFPCMSNTTAKPSGTRSGRCG